MQYFQFCAWMWVIWLWALLFLLGNVRLVPLLPSHSLGYFHAACRDLVMVFWFMYPEWLRALLLILHQGIRLDQRVIDPRMQVMLLQVLLRSTCTTSVPHAPRILLWVMCPEWPREVFVFTVPKCESRENFWLPEIDWYVLYRLVQHFEVNFVWRNILTVINRKFMVL